jgi:hypothetical protein
LAKIHWYESLCAHQKYASPVSLFAGVLFTFGSSFQSKELRSNLIHSLIKMRSGETSVPSLTAMGISVKVCWFLFRFVCYHRRIFFFSGTCGRGIDPCSANRQVARKPQNLQSPHHCTPWYILFLCNALLFDYFLVKDSIIMLFACSWRRYFSIQASNSTWWWWVRR